MLGECSNRILLGHLNVASIDVLIIREKLGWLKKKHFIIGFSPNS